MARILSTIVMVPLNEAKLWPQPECGIVTNEHKCPLCSSETLVLSQVLDGREGERKESVSHERRTEDTGRPA